MRKTALLLIAALLTATLANAATTRNDDSCDVAVLPAATLLLPYFEVDLRRGIESAQTTLFTIVNTTEVPQIAKVTLWTDWAYPVLDIPVYLTGYDVQAINLRDVLVDGRIAPSSSTNPVGARSLGANPRFLAGAAASCANLPTAIPLETLLDVQMALRSGLNKTCENTRIGGQHDNAVGFATIDVMATCAFTATSNSAFLEQMLYDNVLTGDWQILNPDAATGNYASGNPLVHLRAIPEGGAAGERIDTNLPYTFYDRLGGAPRRRIDRRQPLPSAFAARYMQGGAAAFNTNLIVWREAKTGPTASCQDFQIQNSRMPLSGTVRFDERENATMLGFNCVITCIPISYSLPATSRVATSSTLFPPLTSGDTSGWIAINLDNGGSFTYGAPPDRDFRTGSSTTMGPRPSQNWIIPVLFSEGRFSAARDATALANGCSPSPAGDQTGVTSNIPLIGPGPNPTP